jgi:hypothetical protein
MHYLLLDIQPLTNIQYMSKGAYYTEDFKKAKEIFEKSSFNFEIAICRTAAITGCALSILCLYGWPFLGLSIAVITCMPLGIWQAYQLRKQDLENQFVKETKKCEFIFNKLNDYFRKIIEEKTQFSLNKLAHISLEEKHDQYTEKTISQNNFNDELQLYNEKHHLSQRIIEAVQIIGNKPYQEDWPASMQNSFNALQLTLCAFVKKEHQSSYVIVSKVNDVYQVIKNEN